MENSVIISFVIWSSGDSFRVTFRNPRRACLDFTGARMLKPCREKIGRMMLTGPTGVWKIWFGFISSALCRTSGFGRYSGTRLAVYRYLFDRAYFSRSVRQKWRWWKVWVRFSCFLNGEPCQNFVIDLKRYNHRRLASDVPFPPIL